MDLLEMVSLESLSYILHCFIVCGYLVTRRRHCQLPKYVKRKGLGDTRVL